MSKLKDLWDYDEPVGEQPAWIEGELCGNDVEAIYQGGCASGAYMPAVTYYKARQTMAEHGDAILEFIEDHYGELPKIPDGTSWSGIATFYLCYAVHLWASMRRDELLNELQAGEDDET